LGVLRTFNWYR